MKAATKTWVNTPVSFTSETILITIGLGIASALLPLPSEAQTNCVPAPSGLVSWWRAESNPLDSADNNNGTLNVGTGYTAGRVGQAFSFNAPYSGVAIGNPTNLQLQTLTIEGWVKRGSATRATWDVYPDGVVMDCAWGGYGMGLTDDGRLFLTKV